MSFDIKHLETTSNGAEGKASILTAFTNIAKDDTVGDNRATVTKDDLSAPYLVSAEEEARLVANMRAAAQAASKPAVAHADSFWLLAAIRARKGDVKRALPLADNYIQWRSSISSDLVNVAKSEKMRTQLRRRIMFVGGNTDRHGRPVLNLRLRNQDPAVFTAIDTTRMICFVLEWTLRTFPAAQTHGVVIVNDMAGVGFRNLDLRLPGVMQKAFSKTVPVRLASLNAVHPPLFFRAIFPLVQSMLSSKLKARIRIFSNSDKERFLQLFSADQIADDIEGMGGSFSWTEDQHEAWVQRMIADCQTWDPVTSYEGGS